VQPRARRDEVTGWDGRTLRVRVTAPPEDGRATRAVVALLARAFAVPRAEVELVSGAASRDKLFRVGALTPDELRARLGKDRS
jgi:uncharacterized protein (TIGR00251 family)